MAENTPNRETTSLAFDSEIRSGYEKMEYPIRKEYSILRSEGKSAEEARGILGVKKEVSLAEGINLVVSFLGDKNIKDRKKVKEFLAEYKMQRDEGVNHSEAMKAINAKIRSEKQKSGGKSPTEERWAAYKQATQNFVTSIFDPKKQTVRDQLKKGSWAGDAAYAGSGLLVAEYFFNHNLSQAYKHLDPRNLLTGENENHIYEDIIPKGKSA